MRVEIATSLELFTRVMFTAKTDAVFKVAKPHGAIIAALEKVVRGKCPRLIINIPPRYGKTELAVRNFIAYGLALNPSAKFLHLSYSASLAEENSVAIKDIMQLEQYRELFPLSELKKGSDTKTKWETISGGGVYATSTLGQITGFGAGTIEDDMFGGAIVIDDPIKPEDAFSDIEREKVNRRFETTIRSRVNSRNTPIIVIMQRLHEHDLCGYLQETEPNTWEVLKLPAIDDDGQPLWEFKHNIKELKALREIDPLVFETQYMQNPRPLEGLLYDPTRWKTYNDIPITARAVRKNYTDTADTGADNLVSIDYIETEHGNYILDMIVTDAPMEETENAVARMMTKDGIEVANIESNNGGRGFARNVERLLRTLGNNETRVEWFHQSDNKQVRIYSNSAAVQNLTYFPTNWQTLFPKAYKELGGYLKTGRNLHDDVEDALTGTIEKRGASGIQMIDTEKQGVEGVCVLLAEQVAWCRCSKTDNGYLVTHGELSRPTAKAFGGCEEVVCYFTDARRTDAAELVAECDIMRAAKFKSSVSSILSEYSGVLQKLQFSRQNVDKSFIVDFRETNGQTAYIAALSVALCVSRFQKINRGL